jgi:hypothetical protein
VTEPRLFAPPAPQNPIAAADSTPGSPPDPKRRVRITASVDYTLSVPASWVEDPDSEYHEDPDEAVFTWISGNAGQCIDEMDLMDHTVWPDRKRAVS